MTNEICLLSQHDIGVIHHRARAHVNRLTKRPDFPKPVRSIGKRVHLWCPCAVSDFMAKIGRRHRAVSLPGRASENDS
jgi:hypothetical protein